MSMLRGALESDDHVPTTVISYVSVRSQGGRRFLTPRTSAR